MLSNQFLLISLATCKRIVSAALLLLLVSIGLSAQNQLEITIVMPPPYPTNLDEYASYLETGLISVNNTTTNDVEAFFVAELKETSGKFLVSTDGITNESITFEPGPTLLSPTDIEDVFAGMTDQDAIINGLSDDELQAILLNRQLPEGDYDLCIQAFDALGNPISAGPPASCFNFNAQYPERPMLIRPMTDEQVDTLGFMNFTWLHNINDINVLSRTEYTLKVLDVTEEDITNVQSAMFNPGVAAAYEENVGANNATQLQDDIDLPMEIGHTYAARITATDPEGETAYQYGGHSEIVVFTYGDPKDAVDYEEPFVFPEITSPEAEAVLPTDTEKIDFEWTHIATPDIKNKLDYSFYLVDLTTQNLSELSVDGITENPPFYLLEKPNPETTFSFNSSPSARLIEGNSYAAFIQVKKKNEQDASISIPNNGIGEFIYFSYGELAPEEGACVSNCTATLPTNPSSEALKKKDVVFMGTFIMDITKIVNGNAVNGYNGEGEIAIKFMNDVKVKVTFEGLKATKVGGHFQAYEGEASAVVDEGISHEAQFAEFAGAHIPQIGEEASGEIRDAIKNGQKYISAFLPGAPAITLPIGWDREVEGQKMVIGIDRMNFGVESGEMSAIFSIEHPEWGEYIPTLGAGKIVFSPNGFDNQVQLFLANDYEIPGTGAADAPLVLKGIDEQSNEPGCYIDLDCNGFKEGQITAELSFPRTMLLPDMPDGTTGSGQVTATMSGILSKGNHFMLQASIDPFQIVGLDGFSWEVQEASYDHSDLSSPFDHASLSGDPEFAFIDEALGLRNQDEVDLWRGFYIKKVAMRTPNDWASDGTRKSVELENLIIEKSGVTGAFQTTQILNLEEGDLEGWAFSVDTFRIEIVQSSFRQGRMGGRVGMPILTEGESLKYTGLLDQEQDTVSFQFSVRPEESLTVPLFMADLAFTNSEIKIYYSKYRKSVEANLSGSLTMSNELLPADMQAVANQVDVSMPGIGFQGMEFGTHKKFKAPTFEFLSGTGSLAGFPINDDPTEGMKVVSNDNSGDDTPASEGTTIKFTFSPEVSIVGNKNGITASASVEFVSSLQRNANNKVYYSLDAVNPKAMEVDAKTGGFEFDGQIEFYNNYGYKGAKGQLAIKIPSGIGVDLLAEFGVYKNENLSNPSYGGKDYYSYWVVEGLVKLGKAGIPIGVGAFQTGQSLYGFGGGAWYNMTMDKNAKLPSGEESYSDEKSDPSSTGFTFTPVAPVNGSRFGLKATVVFGLTGASETFNADATLAGEFSSSGGYVDLQLVLNAYFMSGFGNNRDNAKVKANGSIGVSNKTGKWVFGGSLKVYMNVEDIIVGNMAGEKDLLVSADMHISADKWYFYMGKPDARGQLLLKLGGASFGMSGYFMVGHGISTKPPQLPQFIADILDGKPVNGGIRRTSKASGSMSTKPTLTHSNAELYSDGQGFAIGMELDYTLDEQYLGFIDVYFKAVAGFDLALVKNNGASCLVDGKTIQPGIEGWYAQGQIYAGIAGSVSIHIDIWFYEGDINILSGSAAFALQGGGPNPVWIEGRARVNYDVLGGLIEGSAKFDMDFGEKCTPYNEDAFAALDFIEDLTPHATPNIKKGQKGPVGVFTDFDLYLRNKIKRYHIPKSLVEPSKGSYIVEPYIASFKLTKHKSDGSDEREVSTVTPVRNVKDNLLYRVQTTEALEETDWYSIEVVLKARDYTDGKNGVPAKTKDKNGNWVEWKEVRKNTFKTANAPHNIPDNIVRETYPFIDMRYYLQDQASEGYLLMTKAFPEVLKDKTSKGKDKVYYFKFTNVETGAVTSAPMINLENKGLVFRTPTLDNNALYRVSLISNKLAPMDYSDIKVDEVYDQQNLSSVAVRNIQMFKVHKDAIISERTGEERILYEWYFATSKYNTIGEKLNAANVKASRNGEKIDLRFEGMELFDHIEQYGFKKDGKEEFGKMVSVKVNYEKGYAKWLKEGLYRPFYGNWKDHKNANNVSKLVEEGNKLDATFKWVPGGLGYQLEDELKNDDWNTGIWGWGPKISQDEKDTYSLSRYQTGQLMKSDIEERLLGHNQNIIRSNWVKYYDYYDIDKSDYYWLNQNRFKAKWSLNQYLNERSGEQGQVEIMYKVPFLKRGSIDGGWYYYSKPKVNFTYL